MRESRYKEKKKTLQKITNEIKNCEICNRYKIGQLVPGEGKIDTKIIFLGEAPGLNESKTGHPFIGRSGKFLTKLLLSIGLKREEVFLTSPVKYYPGNRAPKNEEIRHGMIHTSKQIEIIDPKLIVMLGNVALKALFPNEKFKLSKIHDKIIKKEGRIYFPTFHPAAAMRFPKIRKLMEKDFKKLKKLVKRL